MDFFKKHKCATNHHTFLLLRIVPYPDTVLYSNGARFVLYVLQLSRSTHCFQYATKIIFLISHFYSQKCLLLSTALLHYFLLITSPFALMLQQNFLRQIATNTHLPSPSQKPYHIFIITPHLAHPSCKKRLAISPQKSSLPAPLCQSHASAKLNTPSHSFNPALRSTKHHSPLAERVVVAIQTKCIYYSTATLA